MPSRQRRGCSELRPRHGTGEQATITQATAARHRIQRVADIPRSQLCIAHLAEVLSAVPANRMMAGKTAARRVGPREAAAMVPAAVAAMAAAMTTSMASAALADRRTRQQRR
jgi:sarcosine oxidase gamma subunit